MILELAFTILQATAPINPVGVAFTCPDHALDTEHEVDVLDSSGAVIQTILGGDPPLNAQNEVEIRLNVQPIAFGEYRFRVRAVAGSIKSVDSETSELWRRAPGAPGAIRIIR